MWKKAGSIIRKNWKRILYYMGIAAALSAAAVCAERYRNAAEPEMPVMQPSEIEQAAPEEPSETVFILPETAEILRGFTAEPVWNEKLGCFETHSGTDAAFTDSVARSFCSGVVRAITENAVEIEAGEWTLRVAGLDEICVETGTEIKAGDPLGMQKNGTAQEAWLPPHAHIQLLRGGESVNLEDRL